MTYPQRPVESPHEITTCKIIPSWSREIINDVEKYGSSEGTFRENKKLRPYSSYVDLMCNLIDD